MDSKRNKFLKFGFLCAKTYLVYFTLFSVITMVIGIQALFNDSSFIDAVLYWLPANLIISLLVTIILAFDDYRTGRLKEKLK